MDCCGEGKNRNFNTLSRGVLHKVQIVLLSLRERRSQPRPDLARRGCDYIENGL